ncbi:MAG: SDR family NAD(P)-dependent oxidoreductase, partial [Lachnospiraceae bacterium]|nr:SDR family NAD(P)-dependent oxidoreductase [Lachnospiraceae bacterium]
MDLGLKEKVAVVTGGSKGIGFATAKAFLEEGAKVAICARDRAVLDEAVKELSAYGEVYAEAIDVTEEEAVYSFADRVAEHFGTIDAWVNNVGSSFARKGEQYTQEEIYRHYTVNF